MQWSQEDTFLEVPSGRQHTKPLGGQIYVVFASKGGVGSTMLSVNLASIFARATRRGAVVVDLDLALGDILTALNLEARSSLAEVLEGLEELDSASLKRRLSAHRSGIYALSQAHRLEQLEAVRPAGIAHLLRGLARHFDAVVVDGLRDFGDLSLAALDLASRIVLLVNQDLASVRGAQRCLLLFRQLGYGDERLRVVLNRHRPNAALRPEAIADALASPVFAILANDFRAVERSINDGVPLVEQAPAARVARNIDRLAARLMSESDSLNTTLPSAMTEHKGRFSRLWTRLTGGDR